MSPVFKVFIATAVIALMLLLGVGRFLQSTESLTDSMDLNALTYRKPGAPAPKKAAVVVYQSAMAPDRDGDSVTLGISEQLEAEEELEELAEAEIEEVIEDEDDEESDEEETEEEEVPESEVVMSDEEAARLAASERGESVELDRKFADKEPEEGEEKSGEDGEIDVAENADEPEETEKEARDRKVAEKLGIKKRKEPTRAVDVKLVLSTECPGTGVALAPVSVQFRYDSPTARGASLRQLELLVSEFRRCPSGGAFQLTENALGKVDASPSLTQMRFDELKYFFIQRSVPKAALRYPEST